MVWCLIGDRDETAGQRAADKTQVKRWHDMTLSSEVSWHYETSERRAYESLWG